MTRAAVVGFVAALRLSSLRPLPDSWEPPGRGGVGILIEPRELFEMLLDLSEKEHTALTRHLCEHLQYTKHPFAESYELLKSILTKLDPQSEILLRPEPKQR